MIKWPVVSLSTLVEKVDYGVTASAIRIPSGPKFLRVTDIQNDSVDWEQVPWCEYDERSVQRAQLEPGDIVFARTGATTGKSFLVRDCPARAVFASYLIRIRVTDDIDPEYLAHFFKTPQYWTQISSNARGAAQLGVNASTLRTLKIPLPILVEQRRIASILNLANSLRLMRSRALNKLDDFIKADFSRMFGGDLVEGAKWPIRKIGDLLVSATYGTSEEAGEVGEFPVLRMGNITMRGELDFSNLKYMDLSERDKKRYFVEKGDILFNRTNSPDLVGKTALVRDSRKMAYAGYLIRLRANSENDPAYIAAFLNSAYAKNVLRSMCKSIVGMANINAKQLQLLKIPQPPLDLQREFSRHVDSIERLKAAQYAHLRKLDTLFASLQHRAFRGEL